MKRLILLSLIGWLCSGLSADGGVTHITVIQNDTEEIVEFRCFENPNTVGHNATVPKQSALAQPQIDAWIPWADEQKHLDEGKYVRIRFVQTTKKGEKSNRVIYVWQSKGTVRYSQELKHDADAPAVPGIGTENGKRKIHFNSDGTFEFLRID